LVAHTEGGTYEKRLLRRILECKKEEATKEWRKLHNQQLNDLYCSPNIVRRMRWAGHVAGMERGMYMVLMGKPEEKIPLGRPRRRWEDNITMDLQEVGCGGMEWIELAQDKKKASGTCVCGNESSGSIKCGEFID
jgi:hypothetical protein